MAQLNRGKRLVEVLKQAQYEPLSVEKQVLVVYAGNKGFLDGVAEEKVSDYETELYRCLESQDPSLLSDLAERAKIDDDLTSRIDALLKEFTEQFTAANKTAAA